MTAMKRYILAMTILLTALAASAQTSERYEQRYNLLASQLGPAGVGIETLLDKWEQVDSTSSKMLYARFSYLFTKAQSTSLVTRPEKKYLGMEPLLTFKDSLGNDVHYYQVSTFDDELYGRAVKTAEKLISLYPDRLDYRFLKANAYIAYEKESPDMALSYLLSLVDLQSRRSRPWVYEEEKVEGDFFEEAMQEYCYSFYSIGTPSSMDAFLVFSEKLADQYPSNAEYINNIGSYHLIARNDPKTALKWYSKVLKKNPKDDTALRNSIIAARKMNNPKLENKYRARLEALNSSK